MSICGLLICCLLYGSSCGSKVNSKEQLIGVWELKPVNSDIHEDVVSYIWIFDEYGEVVTIGFMESFGSAETSTSVSSYQLDDGEFLVHLFNRRYRYTVSTIEQRQVLRVFWKDANDVEKTLNFVRLDKL
jgi:hypothetical protein